MAKGTCMAGHTPGLPTLFTTQIVVDMARMTTEARDIPQALVCIL